jgi:hypothetical protein
MITFKDDDEKHAWDLYVAGATSAWSPGVTIDAADIADQLLVYRREREPKTAPTGATTLERAIEGAGFRVKPDLLGKPTLWCVECGRDSGYHRDTCSKAERRNL